MSAADEIEALLNLNHPHKRAVSKWAQATLERDDPVSRDHNSTFDRENWQRCADYGLLGANAPTAVGGAGKSHVETLLMLEGLGHGCSDNGLVFGITSQLWSTHNIIQALGSSAQQQQWLPKLVDGSHLGAFAISEPDTGSDTYAMAATATRSADGGYVLNGHKAWLTLGSVADVIVVFANLSSDKDPWAICAFVLSSEADGVELQPNRDKLGMRTTPFGDIRFTNVHVPDSQRLGSEGIGMGIFNKVMEADRSFVLAGQIGAMQRQLEQSIRYARQRQQFGTPINQFQAVSHRLADMKVRHDVARTMMYKTALLTDRGRQATLAAAISKIVTSEAGVASGTDAIRLFGAKGYVSEFGVDRELRDFLGAVTYSGTTDIQRNLVAKLIGAA